MRKRRADGQPAFWCNSSIKLRMSGMVSYSEPASGVVSHEALEPTYKCTAISNFSDPSNIPEGTQTYGVFLSGLGTVEPQVEQKSERKPVGLTNEEIRSVPESQRKFSAATTVAVFEMEPPCLRHKEQWH